MSFQVIWQSTVLQLGPTSKGLLPLLRANVPLILPSCSELKQKSKESTCKGHAQNTTWLNYPLNGKSQQDVTFDSPWLVPNTLELNKCGNCRASSLEAGSGAEREFRKVKQLSLHCSETTLTGESRYHISPPRGFEPVTLVAGSKQVSPLDQWDMVRIKWDCRLFTGLPPSSRLHRLWSQKGDLQRAWNRDRKAVWDQVGLSHCRHEGLVTVGDEALLTINHVGVTNVARQRY